MTFPTSAGLTVTSMRRVTNSFLINGAPSSRTQFPLQNAFALTVHKTQGLTLPHVYQLMAQCLHVGKLMLPSVMQQAGKN